MPDGLPTPRTTLHARYVRVLLTCWSCKRQRDADLAALVAAGRGDVPLVQLRWRCSWVSVSRWPPTEAAREAAMLPMPDEVGLVSTID